MEETNDYETRRTVLKFCFSVIAVIICILIIPGGFLYLTFGYEKIAIKKAIDNPYVNNKYRGWKTVGDEEYGNFLCPSDWHFANDNDGICRILDADGNIWAVGTKFGTENDAFSSRKDFAETVIGKQIKVFEYAANQGSVFMDGSEIIMVEIQTDKEEKIYYMKLSPDRKEETCLIVLTDLQEASNAFDVAEAIVYSYAYH